MYCHLFIVHSVCKVYIIWHTFGCILLRRLLEQIDKRITTKATGCFCVVVKLIALYCVSFNHYFSMLRSDNRIINELSIYLSIRVYPFAFVAHCWNYIPRVVPLLSDCLVSDGVQENINFLHVLSCISLSIIAWRCIVIRRVLNAEKNQLHTLHGRRQESLVGECFYFSSLPFFPLTYSRAVSSFIATLFVLFISPPLTSRAPLNQLGVWGSAVSSPSGVRCTLELSRNHRFRVRILKCMFYITWSEKLD